MRAWMQVAAVAVAVCVFGPSLRAGWAAQEGPVGMKYGQVVQVKPGELSGKVIYPDGKTPAVETPLRLWSVQDSKFLYEGKTDEKGAYRVGPLENGRYLMVFGDRVFVDVQVDASASSETRTLDVIVPHGQAVFARMEPEKKAAVLTLVGAAQGEGEEKSKEGGGLLPAVIIGAGAGATAVGIVWAVEELNEEDHHGKRMVSP
jgi:hypothetical protein